MLFSEISIYEIVASIPLFLPLILASSLQPISRATLSSENVLQKRISRTLECDHSTARAFTTDTRITSHFTTLHQMCEAYPLGMGLYCATSGSFNHLANRAPQSYLYYSAPDLARNLHAVCIQRCRCVNIVPDTPDISEPPKEKLASLRSDAQEELGKPDEEPAISQTIVISSSRPQQTHAAPDEGTLRCDGRLYGHPIDADCRIALRQQTDFDIGAGWFPREYLGIRARPKADSLEVSGTVQTPVILKSGSCIVLYLLSEINGVRVSNMLVDGHELREKSDETRSRCVQQQGIGGHGSFPRMNAAADRGRSGTPKGVPEIFIYGTDSAMRQYVDHQFACFLDHNNNAQCRNIDAPNNRKDHEPQPQPEAKDEGQPNQQKVHSESIQHRCSGACYDPNDCDINSDCLCASNKGLPLSISWGQHTCMYVAGAAMAISMAAIKPGRPCQGRCLLEEDGTLEIDGALLGSNSSRQASFTNWLPSSLAMASPTATLAPLIFSNNSNQSNCTQSLSSSAGSQLNHDPGQNFSIFENPAPTLYCPCNCTYVSAACCLSRIVWEEPSKSVPMKPPPGNATVCCDAGSGKWLPRSAECPHSPIGADIGGDFRHLGKVKWNSSSVPWEIAEQKKADSSW